MHAATTLLKAHMARLESAGASEHELREAYDPYNREHHRLALAIVEEREQDVRGLLDGGANPNSVDNLGSPVLHIAAAMGQVGSLEALLEAGVPVDDRDAYGWTALIHAANSAQAEAVDFLLSRGANPTLRNEYGQSAAARVPGRAELLRALREAEAGWGRR